MSQYGASPKLIGYVDQAELFGKHESIDSLRTALLVQEQVQFDGGQVTLSGWEYDVGTQLYSEVQLMGCGDFSVWNLSPLAPPIAEWLCGLGESSLLGCCRLLPVPAPVPDCSACDAISNGCVSNTDGTLYCTSGNCGFTCDCQPVCAGGATYCRDDGTQGLYCSE